LTIKWRSRSNFKIGFVTCFTMIINIKKEKYCYPGHHRRRARSRSRLWALVNEIWQALKTRL
jgi:hypothetical protein